ncbi:MAG: hypothetical protein ACI814_004491, partial [Mariniblastus sp.]
LFRRSERRPTRPLTRRDINKVTASKGCKFDGSHPPVASLSLKPRLPSAILFRIDGRLFLSVDVSRFHTPAMVVPQVVRRKDTKFTRLLGKRMCFPVATGRYEQRRMRHGQTNVKTINLRRLHVCRWNYDSISSHQCCDKYGNAKSYNASGYPGCRQN